MGFFFFYFFILDVLMLVVSCERFVVLILIYLYKETWNCFLVREF